MERKQSQNQQNCFIITHLPVITLNWSHLTNKKAQTSRIALEQRICHSALAKKYTSPLEMRHYCSVKEWKKVLQRMQQADTAIYCKTKINLKPKLVRRGFKGHFIVLKGTICQEDIRIVNICSKHSCTLFHKTNTEAVN